VRKFKDRSLNTMFGFWYWLFGEWPKGNQQNVVNLYSTF